MKRIAAILLLCCCLLSGIACAEVEYQGLTFSEHATEIDLGMTVVKDFDAFAAFLCRFDRLEQVNMWENRMTPEQCEFLAERFPQIRWGWTMVLQGKDHKHLIRTDYTSWSTLHNNQSSHHRSEDFRILKYCWNLMALDVGHNSVTDLDFLTDLPNLRVLILACNEVTDITPLASLHYLEYAELFKNRISDLTPLSGLDHLLDLNLCFNAINDWAPVSGLSQLQRLWIYCGNQFAKGVSGDRTRAIKTAALSLRESLPNTEVDYTHYSTAGSWRFLNAKKMHPHYQAIVATFGENHLKPKYEYVPFEDSFPLTEAAPRPTAEPGPQTVRDTPADTAIP